MKLTSKQIQAASMLGEGSLCKDVASAVEVTPQTISAWRKNPDFEALVNSVRLEVLEAARTRIQSLARAAAHTLGDVMENGKSEAMRLKAAAMVLELVGLTNPSSGLWAWGIGGTSPERVEKEWKARSMNSRMSERLAAETEELLNSSIGY